MKTGGVIATLVLAGITLALQWPDWDLPSGPVPIRVGQPVMVASYVRQNGRWVSGYTRALPGTRAEADAMLNEQFDRWIKIKDERDAEVRRAWWWAAGILMVGLWLSRPGPITAA